MKKILSFILAMLIAFSLYACSGDQTGEDIVSTDTNEATESVTEAKKEPYTGVFQAGYGREDITPEVPIPLNTGDMMTRIADPLYVTAIAVYDGENTALIITADIKNYGEDQYLSLVKRISTTTKVPEENIMFSATHNHSSPRPGIPDNNTTVLKWSAQVVNKTVDACKAAIEDLANAEIYVGSFKTKGMAFVRRYILEDGSFADIMTVGNKKVVAYESEADDTAQLIRFVRADKKDILLTNWQCHLATMVTVQPVSISSDLAYFVRREVEKDKDLLVAYYQGASGNINTTAKVEGSAKYPSYELMAKNFGQMTLKAASLEKMTKVEAGTISAKRENYTAQSMKYSDEKVAQALEAKKANYPADLLEKYGFSHYREVDAVAATKNVAETSKFYISAMRFGDISLVAVPYEMYDTNGKHVKDNSPAEMTFVLTCAGGSYAYVPSTEASKHGGYDAYKTAFAYGTGDAVAEYLVEMLKKLG